METKAKIIISLLGAIILALIISFIFSPKKERAGWNQDNALEQYRYLTRQREVEPDSAFDLLSFIIHHKISYKKYEEILNQVLSKNFTQEEIALINKAQDDDSFNEQAINVFNEKVLSGRELAEDLYFYLPVVSIDKFNYKDGDRTTKKILEKVSDARQTFSDLLNAILLRIFIIIIIVIIGALTYGYIIGKVEPERDKDAAVLAKSVDFVFSKLAVLFKFNTTGQELKEYEKEVRLKQEKNRINKKIEAEDEIYNVFSRLNTKSEIEKECRVRIDMIKNGKKLGELSKEKLDSIEELEDAMYKALDRL